jgi:hypothetical protein
MGSGITAAETLMPTDGWVGCTTNAAGVEGAFFTFGDGLTSTIMPTDFAGSGSEICVTGEVGQVVDGDYTVYGAGVGFNFADEAAWNATAAGASGVSFNITALPTGTDTRIIFTTAAGGYCMALTAAGQQTVKFSQTSLDCWEAGGAAPTETGIISVQWQVTTNAESSHPFSFCIEGLAVVP